MKVCVCMEYFYLVVVVVVVVIFYFPGSLYRVIFDNFLYNIH